MNRQNPLRLDLSEDPYDQFAIISGEVIRQHPLQGFDDLVALWIGIDKQYTVNRSSLRLTLENMKIFYHMLAASKHIVNNFLFAGLQEIRGTTFSIGKTSKQNS